MATADDSAASGVRRWLVPVCFVATLATAITIGLAIASGDEAAAPGANGSQQAAVPIEVDATSIYQFDTLAEMVAASDLVVVGTVVATEPGRLVGDPDDGGVISRLVTIDVDEVVVGAPTTAVLVEEEGTLPDGTPLVVNGVAGSEMGDHGIWFLDSVDGTDVPTHLVINSQGRFLTTDSGVDGGLVGGDQRDALVQALQQQSLDSLIAATRTAAAETPSDAGS